MTAKKETAGVIDGDEYEVIPDDTETDVEGEHPEGDYPPEIYNDDEFDEDVDDTEPAEPEDEED